VSRKLLAALALAACLGAIALVLVLRQPSDTTPGVEQRLRNALTRPGPDQITPNGEHPKTIKCRKESEGRWLCAVSYPSGVRLQCRVGERALDQGPICE
jgi:hypothetical protein